MLHMGLSYLSHFIAKQDKDQRVENQLRQVWHRMKIHEQHIGEEQEEGDVEDHVPGEDHKGGGEEGHVVPQELPVPVHRLLPGRRESFITVLANTMRTQTPGRGGESGCSKMDWPSVSPWHFVVNESKFCLQRDMASPLPV